MMQFCSARQEPFVISYGISNYVFYGPHLTSEKESWSPCWLSVSVSKVYNGTDKEDIWW